MNRLSVRGADSRLTLLKFGLIGATVALAIALGWMVPLAFQENLWSMGARSLSLLIMLIATVVAAVFFISRPRLVQFGAVLAMAPLIASTGMQLDVGAVRTSALEVLIVALAALVLSRRVLRLDHDLIDTFPLWRPLTLFLLFLPWGLLVAGLRGIDPANVLMTVKGFYLYPLLAALLYLSIRNPRQFYLIVGTGLLFGTYVSATAYFNNVSVVYDLTSAGFVSRLGGAYGIINQFGFYAASFGLLALGIALEDSRLRLRVVAGVVATICISAMALTLSRGALAGFVVGLLVLALLTRRRLWLVALAVIGWLTLLQAPVETLATRITPEFFLADNAIVTRQHYVTTAITAIKEYPFGAGWGAWFYSGVNGTLYRAEGLPWAHNDYLNIGVQVGIAGLLSLLYLILFYLRTVWRALSAPGWDPTIRPFVFGGLAASVALFVHAATDHVFWRPDIAGQLWWVIGVTLAGIKVGLPQPESGVDESPV